MFWPTVLRFIWYLMTWEYLGYALETFMQGANVWVDIVRGGLLYWAINNSADNRVLVRDESRKWKKKHRKGYIKKAADLLTSVINGAIQQIGRVVTWAIGSEPTDKERLTWTKAPFNCQRRVRYDRSTGQGYNKRKTGTSQWHRTTAIVCLLATAHHTQATKFAK